MAIKTIKSTKADLIGASASLLCLLHCIIAPLLFLAQASLSSQHLDVPIWYRVIDYVFLIISFLAIVYSIKSTTKVWIKRAFWLSWIVLTSAILNESFGLVYASELVVYLPALSLIGLHLYNHRFCQRHQAVCL